MFKRNEKTLDKLSDAFASKSEEELLNCFEIAKAIHELKALSNGKISSIAFSCDNEEDGILIKDAYDFLDETSSEDCDRCSGCDECNESAPEDNDVSCTDRVEELEETLNVTLTLLEVSAKAGAEVSKRFNELQSEYAILEQGIKDLTAKYGR